MAKSRRTKRAAQDRAGDRAPHDARPASLRIIAGRNRGRRLEYHGNAHTRPMKDRVRQALFNLLADDVRGKHAIDLFAGTGALGLEALSRGAASATFFERHHATADLVRRNAERLGELPHVRVLAVDTLACVLRGHGLPESRDATDWLAFVSPPYDFYVDRREEMIALIQLLAESAPKASVLVVESDARFDIHTLDALGAWDIREYPPARIGILRLAEN